MGWLEDWHAAGHQAVLKSSEKIKDMIEDPNVRETVVQCISHPATQVAAKLILPGGVHMACNMAGAVLKEHSDRDKLVEMPKEGGVKPYSADETERLLFDIKRLQDENKKLQSEKSKLQSDNKKLQSENSKLQSDNKKFQVESTILQSQTTKLQDELIGLIDQSRRTARKNLAFYCIVAICSLLAGIACALWLL